MTQGTLNWKLCKRCGEFFDIGTNWNICPKCKKEIIEKKEKMGEIKNGRK